MARVSLSLILYELRGAFGEYVFKRSGGKTILTRRATHKDTIWSAWQKANRKRFYGQAVAYGRRAMADPEYYAVYRALGKKLKKTTNCLAIRDFYHAPEIVLIDPSAYSGLPGDTIKIQAKDDVGVIGVEVVIRDEAGRALERGAAVEKRGSWIYTATTAVPEGAKAVIEAEAIDRPGGTGRAEIEMVIVRSGGEDSAQASRRRSKKRAARKEYGFLELLDMLRNERRMLADGSVYLSYGERMELKWAKEGVPLA